MPRTTQLVLPKDFLELLSCFERARCRYLVVGGHAVAVAGRPRATEDLDLLVEPSTANAARVGEAIRAFGFPAYADAVAREFVRPKRMASIGVKPFQVDIMTSISGVSFAQAWAGRMVVRLGGLRVPFLGATELVANKLASGRDKDLIDAANLRELLAAGKPPRRRRSTSTPSRPTPSRRRRRRSR